MRKGVLAGYPVVDVKVNLIDGSYHEVDSSEMAFKLAASQAFKRAFHFLNNDWQDNKWPYPYHINHVKGGSFF